MEGTGHQDVRALRLIYLNYVFSGDDGVLAGRKTPKLLNQLSSTSAALWQQRDSMAGALAGADDGWQTHKLNHRE